MIHVLADRNIPFLSDYLSHGVQLSTFNPDSGLPPSHPCDALLVRTVTPVNEQTLGKAHLTRLKFVGTASSGADHIDTRFLLENGIHFASALGCNRMAVAEYVGTALLEWTLAKEQHPEAIRVGIVGVGNAGSAVAQCLQKIGFEVVLYDPPRAIHDPEFESAPEQDILACDVITFHTPLDTNPGPHCTYHWLDDARLSQSKAKLIINAARGGVVSEATLLKSLDAGRALEFILDVWESEPDPGAEIVKKARLSTPHIAGYSQEAKRLGTQMILEAMMQFFGLPFRSAESKSDSGSEVAFKTPDAVDLTDMLRSVHPLFAYSRKMKEIWATQHGARPPLFASLRTHTELRHEFRSMSFSESLLNSSPYIRRLLRPEHPHE